MIKVMVEIPQAATHQVHCIPRPQELSSTQGKNNSLVKKKNPKQEFGGKVVTKKIKKIGYERLFHQENKLSTIKGKMTMRRTKGQNTLRLRNAMKANRGTQKIKRKEETIQRNTLHDGVLTDTNTSPLFRKGAVDLNDFFKKCNVANGSNNTKTKQRLKELCGPNMTCLQCHRSFKKLALLHRHIKGRHCSKKSDYNCAICDKVFFYHCCYYIMLAKERKKKSIVKKKKEFHQKANLMCHILTHLKNRIYTHPFKCVLCEDIGFERKFTRKSSLRRHVETKHPLCEKNALWIATQRKPRVAKQLCENFNTKKLLSTFAKKKSNKNGKVIDTGEGANEPETNEDDDDDDDDDNNNDDGSDNEENGEDEIETETENINANEDDEMQDTDDRGTVQLESTSLENTNSSSVANDKVNCSKNGQTCAINNQFDQIFPEIFLIKKPRNIAPVFSSG
ncbi:zinc finger protein [Reticulomyxa filosa]|uniref:Zinc finger protein n=1 Tax=Reticulomyxa filosa TaxID=46433 RepID=X6N5L8_RETFI|nr:zinc finger protein [Reticulomyxa filosa]|eukprot:ETO21039.1 zinc finger protein [Reticulomyxa filosa]